MRQWIVAVVAMLLATGTARAEELDNAGIVSLHKAGLGAGAIVAKINTLPCNYDISTAAMIRLRKDDVPSGVIAAMIDRCAASVRPPAASAADPLVAHPAGIYVMRHQAQPAAMALIRPSKAGSIKISGNGSVFFPRKSTLVIPDAESRNIVETGSPTFYFYFAPDDRHVSDFGTANSNAAQSPAEFSLVALKVADQAREVSVGQVNGLRGRAGIDPKAAIAFGSDEIGESIFKVAPAAPLPPGEYAFVITGANNAARVYDFSVR